MNKPEALHIRKTTYSPGNKHSVTVILEPVFSNRKAADEACKRMCADECRELNTESASSMKAASVEACLPDGFRWNEVTESEDYDYAVYLRVKGHSEITTGYKVEEDLTHISESMIRCGIAKGIVSFITDPILESGTVCKIGDFWFYFDGFTAEEMSPGEFVKAIPEDDIVSEIVSTLNDFMEDEELMDEQKYYNAVLREGLGMTMALSEP